MYRRESPAASGPRAPSRRGWCLAAWALVAGSAMAEVAEVAEIAPVPAADEGGSPVALASASEPIAAPVPFAAPFERRFEALSEAYGLSNRHVTALAQDGAGFLWIGTDEGLNRFDGGTVRVFRRAPGEGTTGLASNRISALLVARDGTLWVGKRGGGLSRFRAESESFETFRHDGADEASLSEDDVVGLAEDERGRLWIATFRGGLSLLAAPAAPGAPRFLRLVHDPEDPASLGDDRTRAVLADRFGEIWVATMGGVERLVGDPARGDAAFAFAHDWHRPGDSSSLPDDEVWALCRDRSGALWVGMWGADDSPGLARARLAPARDAVAGPLVFEAFARGERPNELADPRVRRIVEDARGTLWIATRGGLHELDVESRDAAAPRFTRHLHDSNWRFGLPDDDVEDLLEDVDGDLWIATGGGLARVDRSLEGSRTLRTAPGSRRGLSGEPQDAWIDRDGVLWIATSRGLDRVLPAGGASGVAGAAGAIGTGGEVEHFAADAARAGAPGVLPSKSALELLESRKGRLWLATYQYLVTFERPSPPDAAPRFAQVADGLSSNAVLSLLEAPDGALWVGTYRALHRLVPGVDGRPVARETFRHDPDDPSTLSSQSVSALAFDAAGALWIGTYFGLNRLEPATGRVTRLAGGGLEEQNVTSLAFDRAGTLWIGTQGGGLRRLDPRNGESRRLGVEDGLPSENVASVAVDAVDRVWFASSRGLVRFDPATGKVRIFDRLDGLPDDAVSWLRIGRSGELLVGTDDGVTRFDPLRLEARGRAPSIALTRLRLANRPVAIGGGSVLSRALGSTEKLVLGPGDDLVTFEFAAISFRRPERSRYRYRMAGLDSGWIETDASDPKATYTRLPPGSYTFRVQGANGDGVWNERGATLAIEVLPPWYLTWWARTAAALLALAAAVALPLLRLRRARRLNVLLEGRVAERTAELTLANRRLDEAARTDFLTGLPNRREWLERAGRERTAERRTGRPLSLAVGDLDDFKSINDTHGHACGDAVLVELAARLAATVRARDLVARWGGEEFILLFPETDAAGAAVVAEKLRAAVADRPFVWRDGQLRVTLTLGVVAIPPEASLEAAIRAADRALYDGKRAGKNRVVEAPPASRD